MTIDVTQAKIKAKDCGVYCEDTLVARFYNYAEAGLWIVNLQLRGLSFPYELRQCNKKEKVNKKYLIKFINI